MRSSLEVRFSVEYAAAAMEQVRQEAMDALFSVPHGGAEIGGVLFGVRTDHCVRVLAARPLECEHAMGPTFKLSANDHTRLAELLAGGCGDAGGQAWEPVGWYHSHTRSEILLSPLDIEIHNRYFPGAWQVALVVRPHAMQPMRTGFFFRQEDGSMHECTSVVEPAVSPATKPLPAAVTPKRSRSWFWWPIALLALAASLLLHSNGRARVLAAGLPPSIGLVAHDVDGQLRIHWDAGAGLVRSATSGRLEISDGAVETIVILDRARLRDGTVAYTRAGAHVELGLVLREKGATYQEFANFVGAGLPDPGASAAGLRRQLTEQSARRAELEHSVAGLRWLLRQEQARRRMPPPSDLMPSPPAR